MLSLCRAMLQGGATSPCVQFDTSADSYNRGATIYQSVYGGIYAFDAWSGLCLWHFLIPNLPTTQNALYYQEYLYVGSDHMSSTGGSAYFVDDAARYTSPAYMTPTWSGFAIGYIIDNVGINTAATKGVNITTGATIWTNPSFTGSGRCAGGDDMVFCGV